MATSVLDVRGTLVPPRGARSPARAGTAAPGALRRVPVAALAAGSLSVVQAVVLLAGALTGLDGVLGALSTPGGPLVAVGVLALAGWIVLAAGSGAAVIDGTGRRTFAGLALAEAGLVASVGVLAATTSIAEGVALPLPLPAIVALVLAVPVAKLLLVGVPGVRQWVAQGPRVRELRPDPVAAHRLLAGTTLGVIGAALVALTVLAPVPGSGAGPGGTVASVADQP